MAGKAAQKPERQARSSRTGLEENAFDLIREAGGFTAQVHPETAPEVAKLVRSMNCYYSNLIEGHHTHPRDIDRALRSEFASRPDQRNLQLEAAAHIHVQEALDDGRDPKASPVSREYLFWLHKELLGPLPEEFLWMESPETKKRKKVRPGDVRDGEVRVGQYLPPPASEVGDYLRGFEKTYDFGRLTKLGAVMALGETHYRLAWIHPFNDGNGRVARLMSHAMFSRLGLGNGLWSLAQGLARRLPEYWNRLAGPLDDFSEYFLGVAVDQVRFMTGLLDIGGMLQRMEAWCEAEAKAKRIEAGSFPVLRELWLMGSLERAKVPVVANVKERQARQIVSRLTAAGVLQSETSRSPLRLKIPLGVVEAWFPGIYPPFSRIPETGAPASIVLGMM